MIEKYNIIFSQVFELRELLKNKDIHVKLVFFK